MGLGLSRLWVAVGALAIFAVSAGSSRADTLEFVTDRAALNANDSVNWLNVGWFNATEGYENLSNDTVVTSTDGETLTISHETSGNFGIQEEGTGPYQYNGDFSPGDSVLSTANGGMITITFSMPVSAVGANIQGYAQTDDSILNVYTIGGPLEGTTVVGNHDVDTNAGTAPFVGAVDQSGAGITQVTFDVNAQSDFAINQLSFASPDGLVSTPLPKSVVGGLGLLGLVGMGALRRRRAMA